MSKVLIVGAGASGLIASYFAANNGNDVVVFEKNEKAGKKIYITGKGRCNLTNDCEPSEYIKNVVRNPKFTYGAINSFSPSDTIDFFNSFGLKLKTERGKRVFPESDKASDVTKTLLKACDSVGVKIIYNATVTDIVCENSVIKGVMAGGEFVAGDKVIICTGGISYPLTGSTGDGFSFAKKVGHNVSELKPALIGLELFGDLHKKLQGLSLKNVSLTAFINGGKVFSEMGELLFTHFGISGPLVLTCSSLINRAEPKSVSLSIDLKPALDESTLDSRLIREFEAFNKKSIINAIATLEPKSLALELLYVSGINENKRCCDVTSKERGGLLHLIKNIKLEYKGLRPVEEAIVTSGGVCVDEINPKTMESKIIKGLFFAGEVIDVDAFTGGYNLQTAFSTGFLAGKSV